MPSPMIRKLKQAQAIYPLIQAAVLRATTWPAALAAFFATVLVSTVLISLDYRHAHEAAVRELDTQTRLTAIQTAVALAFNDVASAQETLNAFQSIQNIQSACLYDSTGNAFACYPDTPQTPVVDELSSETQADLQRAAHPVQYQGQSLGQIQVTYNLSPVSQRLVSKATIAIGAGLLAMIPALFLATFLRRRFMAPLKELMHAAQRIAAVDESRHLATAQKMARLGYWTWDLDTGLITVSEQLAEITGFNEPELINDLCLNDVLARVDNEDREKFHTDLRRAAQNCAPVSGNYRVRTRGGDLLYVHQRLEFLPKPDGTGSIFATMQDVTARMKSEQQIKELAYYDDLTSLPNRTSLYQRVEQMIRRAQRTPRPFALMFLDLDGFKDINDSLGHDGGDSLLRTIAQRLETMLREEDFIARLGGDEFCMLLQDIADEIDISTIATRLLQNIEQKVVLGSRTINPNVSIGIARYPDDGNDIHTLLRAGDSAMYAAKEAGKHRFEFFDHAMTLQARERLNLAQELRAALASDQFELYYQPQIALSSGRPVGYEALIRWNHPTKGLVSPNHFVPEMERIGLIKDLGEWVILHACEQIGQWQNQGLDDLQVSVNIAPSHFVDPNLPGYLHKILSRCGVEPGSLELEILESSIQCSEQTIEIMQRIKEQGVSIAIDDFGAGYSSLGSLRHLPMDCMKVDRMFISELANRPKDAVLLGTIMSLAHALNLRVIAEGTEDLEQVQILQALNCDIAQGYFFSRPRPASDIPEIHNFDFLPKTILQSAAI